MAYGTLVLWPGIEPTSPTLKGSVLTTGPPGKSLFLHLYNERPATQPTELEAQNPPYILPSPPVCGGCAGDSGILRELPQNWGTNGVNGPNGIKRLEVKVEMEMQIEGEYPGLREPQQGWK